MELQPLILVVDDDPAIRQLVRLALDSAGYEVATAPSGETALAWLAETRPDLVVLDLSMPGFDSSEVLRRLRWDNRPGGRVPVVVLLDRTISRMAAFEAGADHYLLKPLSPQEVVARVAAILPRPVDTPTAETEAALVAESEAA
jgi:two-component system OmpR family response regulator